MSDHDEFTISMTLPEDASGMIDQRCPNCKGYFKIKLDEADAAQLSCPYCREPRAKDGQNFATPEQIEALKQAGMAEVQKMFNDVLTPLKKSKFVKVTTSKPVTPTVEIRGVEARLTCSSCDQAFGINGPIENSRCPRCGTASATS